MSLVVECLLEYGLHIVELRLQVQPHPHPERVRSTRPQDIVQADMRDKGPGVIVRPYFRII